MVQQNVGPHIHLSLRLDSLLLFRLPCHVPSFPATSVITSPPFLLVKVRPTLKQKMKTIWDDEGAVFFEKCGQIVEEWPENPEVLPAPYSLLT